MKKQELHQKNIALILGERERVARALASCEMVKKVYPSDANFILVEVNNADKVYAKLARRNIIVRNRSRQVENCLRITIGSPEENDLLITTFKNLTL
jgi:histidinol-phosphate aminotransferase